MLKKLLKVKFFSVVFLKSICGYLVRTWINPLFSADRNWSSVSRTRDPTFGRNANCVYRTATPTLRKIVSATAREPIPDHANFDLIRIIVTSSALTVA